jgi:hypothetical protein
MGTNAEFALPETSMAVMTTHPPPTCRVSGVLTEKLADVESAGTVTEDGTLVSCGLLLTRLIVRDADEAAANVTTPRELLAVTEKAAFGFVVTTGAGASLHRRAPARRARRTDSARPRVRSHNDHRRRT